MEITSVSVVPSEVQGTSKLRGVARIDLDNQLQLTALRIFEGVNGLFVAYPNDPSGSGTEPRSLYMAIDRGLRDSIESAVIDKYMEITSAEEAAPEEVVELATAETPDLDIMLGDEVDIEAAEAQEVAEPVRAEITPTEIRELSDQIIAQEIREEIGLLEDAPVTPEPAPTPPPQEDLAPAPAPVILWHYIKFVPQGAAPIYMGYTGDEKTRAEVLALGISEQFIGEDFDGNVYTCPKDEYFINKYGAIGKSAASHNYYVKNENNRRYVLKSKFQFGPEQRTELLAHFVRTGKISQDDLDIHTFTVEQGPTFR